MFTSFLFLLFFKRAVCSAARIRTSLLSRRLSKGCGECGGFVALLAFLVVATIYAQTGPDISSVVVGSSNALLITIVLVFVLGGSGEKHYATFLSLTSYFFK